MAASSILTPHRRSLVGGILLLGVAITGLISHYSAREEYERVHGGFLSRAQTQATVAAQHLRSYEEMVYSMRDAFLGQNTVTRAEFAQVAQALLQRHTGVRALEWVRIIPDEQRASFEHQLSQEIGRPAVIVRRQADGSPIPAPADREYFVITYVEPVAGNEVVLGYDVKSAPTGALVSATRTDRQLKVSQPIQLFQSRSPKDEPGVVFLLPFWRAGPHGDGPVEGCVQGVFHVRTMLALSHQLTTSESLDTYYLDLQAAPGTSPLLYSNLGGTETAAAAPPVALPPADDPADFHETLTVGDRQWRMVIRPNAAWVKRVSSHQPEGILAAGLTITALLALMANSFLQRTDRIEREVAERTRELRASETRLQDIVDHSPALIFLKDPAGRYLLCNQPFLDLCQRTREEVIGARDAALFPVTDADIFGAHDAEVLAAGRPMEFEEFLTRPDGRRWTCIVQKFPLFDEQGKLYALCGIATDITGRKAGEEQKLALERRLLESQKLESLGVLAGGIAHDFNNILTAILGNANLAALELPSDHGVRPLLRHIEHASRRASDLCAQMLAYAGKAAFIITPVNLTALVRDTAALLEVSVGRRVRLELKTVRDLPAVQADATQLRQIVMNLVINAADAIGDRADGRIVVSTFARQVTADFFAAAVQAPALPAGAYVVLEVADNGTGMGPDVLARIFEPFFTTKFSGRGLGLAAVLGIVQSHHGALFVESTPGRGTVFRLLLPASAARAGDTAPPITAAPVALKGTVLVVDDEESVRDVALRALRSVGLQVIEVGDGQAALLAYRQRAADINLVLLDLTMPGLSGEETLRQLRMVAPTLPVVVMSGYSEAETTRRCASLGVSAYLPKPFELADLVARMRTHLDPTARPGA
jgi:PAS domain S-box-containing protein